MSRNTLLFWLAAAAAVGVGAAGATAQDKAPVVVELFTSEGCSSCPPADAFLGELAQRPDIVPLAFHVDYWDYIGWKDPYASPANTRRQHDYVAALGLHMVYTPQMVIDGRTDVAGSDRNDVEAAIAKAAARAKLAISIEKDASGAYRVIIPAAAAPAGGSATVWLALFDSEQETAVKRGENSGRTLKEYNIVREWRKIGTWNGDAAALPLDVAMADPDRNGCAVIVQSDPVGPILGAALMKLDETRS
jgi:hypothetical protein